MRRKRYGIRKRKKRSPKYYTIKRLLGSGISRPYKDKNRLMLGSGNKLYKQTALTAAPAVIDFLGKIIR